ncbi:MAG: hypothetical protein J0H71_10670 [Rhizobiales bacterium]|nr:hypothetical protein [Hyphomicrobiales bacterium]
MARERRSIPIEADEPAGDGGPDEAARFIAGAVSELALMARVHRLNMLAHVLDMAQMEADELVRAHATRNSPRIDR